MVIMTSEVLTSGAGFWYDPDDRATGPQVLEALRTFRTAEADARTRARTSLGVGETALAALRIVGEGEARGHGVSPKELADRLGVTAASTSALVDKLVRAGHLVRHPDPNDRRGVTLTTRGPSVRRALHAMGELETRTIRAAESMPPEALGVVIEFLHEMTRVVDDVDAGETDR
jgi:DNA-binding MarR family transcriptional regulator